MSLILFKKTEFKRSGIPIPVLSLSVLSDSSPNVKVEQLYLILRVVMIN